MRIFLIVSLLVSNISHAQGYQENNYQRDDQEFRGGGPDQGQGQGQPGQGKTGLGRKGLLDSMDISDKTKLDEREKCNTKCEMTFVQCYRIQTDRAKCYSTQQECLGKCGGDVAASPDYESQPAPSGSVMEFQQ